LYFDGTAVPADRHSAEACPAESERAIGVACGKHVINVRALCGSLDGLRTSNSIVPRKTTRPIRRPCWRISSTSAAWLTRITTATDGASMSAQSTKRVTAGRKTRPHIPSDSRRSCALLTGSIFGTSAITPYGNGGEQVFEAWIGAEQIVGVA
jgi:hypothetical protein